MLIILSACSIISYASNLDNSYVATDDGSTTTDESSTTTDDSSTTTDDSNTTTDDGYVVTMYLCSIWNSVFPHVFLYFENISDEEITVGKYILPVGQGVSIGTFGLTVRNGAGVYYNLECWCNRSKNGMTVLNISKKLTKSQLQSASNKICSINHWDPILFNCCYFASQVWNAAGVSYVFPIVCLPSITRIQMFFKGCSSSLSLYKPERNQVYRQRGTGGSAYIDLVSDSTL